MIGTSRLAGVSILSASPAPKEARSRRRRRDPVGGILLPGRRRPPARGDGKARPLDDGAQARGRGASRAASTPSPDRTSIAALQRSPRGRLETGSDARLGVAVGNQKIGKHARTRAAGTVSPLERPRARDAERPARCGRETRRRKARLRPTRPTEAPAGSPRAPEETMETRSSGALLERSPPARSTPSGRAREARRAPAARTENSSPFSTEEADRKLREELGTGPPSAARSRG